MKKRIVYLYATLIALGIGGMLLMAQQAVRPLPAESQITVNSSSVGGGSAQFTQPEFEPWHKTVEIYLNNLKGSASYTFPVPFQFTPQVLSQSLANAVTALSTTSVTVTGSGSTGFIMLDGF